MFGHHFEMDLRDLVDCGFRVLLVGEGDFSFARSLLGNENEYSGLFATAFDSEVVCREKYERFDENILDLRRKKVNVLFHCDATNLRACNELRNELFDIIWFNFPHVSGGASHKDVEANRMLIRMFLQSSRDFLSRPKGFIGLTLRDTPFYQNFHIRSQCTAENYSCSTEPFDASLYPGYEPVRTNPSKDPSQSAPPSTDAMIYIAKPLYRVGKRKSMQSTVRTVDDTLSPCKVCGTCIFSSERERNRHFNSKKHARERKRQKH